MPEHRVHAFGSQRRHEATAELDGRRVYAQTLHVEPDAVLVEHGRNVARLDGWREPGDDCQRFVQKAAVPLSDRRIFVESLQLTSRKRSGQLVRSIVPADREHRVRTEIPAAEI